MSGDKRLKIHIGGKCHLASNVTCLLVVKCLWRQLSQPLTGVRGPASKVWATNVLGVKQLESTRLFCQFLSTVRHSLDTASVMSRCAQLLSIMYYLVSKRDGPQKTRKLLLVTSIQARWNGLKVGWDTPIWWA